MRRYLRHSTVEQDVLRSYSLPRENKDAHTPWQLESLRTCRSWIEQDHLAQPFNFRLVRVAKDTDVRSFAIQKGSPVFRELAAFIQNMTDGDAVAGQFNNGLGWKFVLFIIIDVTGDSGDWRDLLQLFDHGLIANVPGVENVIDAFKMSSNRRIE